MVVVRGAMLPTAAESEICAGVTPRVPGGGVVTSLSSSHVETAAADTRTKMPRANRVEGNRNRRGVRLSKGTRARSGGMPERALNSKCYTRGMCCQLVV